MHSSWLMTFFSRCVLFFEAEKKNNINDLYYRLLHPFVSSFLFRGQPLRQRLLLFGLLTQKKKKNLNIYPRLLRGHNIYKFLLFFSLYSFRLSTNDTNSKSEKKKNIVFFLCLNETKSRRQILQVDKMKIWKTYTIYFYYMWLGLEFFYSVVENNGFFFFFASVLC